MFAERDKANFSGARENLPFATSCVSTFILINIRVIQVIGVPYINTQIDRCVNLVDHLPLASVSS